VVASREEEGDEITLEPLSPRTFDSDSPVTAYWLTRCDGFAVAGVRGPAVVEGTVFDEDPLQPVALRVRRGQHGSRLIPIDAVEAVCPMRRVLYVRRPRSAASRAVGGLSALGPHGRHATRKTSQSVAAAWRYSAPRAVAAGVAGGAAARRQWPWVRRTLVTCVQAAVVFVLMIQALLVWAGVSLARGIRVAVVATRRHAPGASRRWLLEPLAESRRRVTRLAPAARHAYRYARRRRTTEMGMEVME